MFLFYYSSTLLRYKYCVFQNSALHQRRPLPRYATPNSPFGSAIVSQGEPGGFLSNGASTHLPAAALPAIVSVFVDASSARLWKTAPAVRPSMSALDLERSWHLEDRVGIDVRLGTIQVSVCSIVSLQGTFINPPRDRMSSESCCRL